MGILPSGFFIVTPLAQCSPIAPVPEQVRITTVRNAMIDNHCLRIFSMLQALLTQRMRSKERF